MSHALMALAHRFLQQRRLERKRWLHDCNIYVMSDYQNIYFFPLQFAKEYLHQILNLHWVANSSVRQMPIKWNCGSSPHIVYSCPVRGLTVWVHQRFPSWSAWFWRWSLTSCLDKAGFGCWRCRKKLNSCTGKYASTATGVWTYIST